jgi:hypothetical protein
MMRAAASGRSDAPRPHRAGAPIPASAGTVGEGRARQIALITTSAAPAPRSTSAFFRW